MEKSVAVYEKPTPHLGLPDWYAKQWELQQSASERIAEASELRNSARTVRNETQIRTKWDTYRNDERLQDRVRELSSWRSTLSNLLSRLAEEKNLLEDVRAEAEKDVENLQHPLEITAQCISMRDSRRGTELTYDDPDPELKKELKLFESMKTALSERIQSAWEKANRLEEVRFQVNLDLQDKSEAWEIDAENASLSRDSSGISYKPNALRIPKSSNTYETWLEHCQCTNILAESEMRDTRTFCEITRAVQKRARNDIEAQQSVTDYSLRKRIHQTQKARNEMEWQKRKVANEMQCVEQEIRRLEEALQDKVNVMKCAETRLENRTYRPGYELCRDACEAGLRDEVLQLRQSQKDLTVKIGSTKAAYNRLESLLIQIERNLDDKQHSLKTDIMCLEMRSSLVTSDHTRLSNETNRNILLTRLENEIPLET